MTEHVDAVLATLASKNGVGLEFWDWRGHHRQASAQTVQAVLAALGVDASTDELAAQALEAHELESWRHLIPMSTIVRSGNERVIDVHVPDGDPVEVWIELENGDIKVAIQQDRYTPPRCVDGAWVGRAAFAIPCDLPLGWHTLHARTPSGEAAHSLVVVPHRLELPGPVARQRQWGFQAQLYSVRSQRSWGLGDFADLAELAAFSGDLGAGFVLINPLHAAEPTVPMTPSPYLPTTRRFVNPLYLRVEDIHETAYLSGADRSLIDWQAETVMALNRSTAPLDRNAVWAAKKAALEIIFDVPRSMSRQTSFENFCDDQGSGLEDFATWCALVEYFEVDPEVGLPEEVRDHRGPRVAQLRGKLAGRIEFHKWLQWVSDAQLAAAQACARAAGMQIGIIEDLAVGVHSHGADAWSLPGALASDVSVGAPPDMFNQQGQNWSQPPWSPTGLAMQGYRPFRDMLRTIFRHAGAVRIDHILGLFRLWWVPANMPADEGAYVYYDHEALVGILCLEAQRAGVIVIGEDLGVVEPWVRDYLQDRGILGTSVLWFEKDGDTIRAPEQWRHLALATVTTHDLPPTAGYLAGEHVELRELLGLLTEPIEQVRQADRAEQRTMFDELERRGLCSKDSSEREKVEALHRFVCLSPSALVGVALTDAVGERRTQNQPGTDQEYPNWKIPLADSSEQAVLIEDLPHSARLRSLVESLTVK